MSKRGFFQHNRNASAGQYSLANANLAFDGNSLTNHGEPCYPGENYGAGAKYPDQLLALSPWASNGSTINNRATSGQTTAQMISGGALACDAGASGSTTRGSADVYIDSQLISGRPNILIVWEGTNDIYINGNATTAYNNLVSYCQARKNAGWKVVILTVLNRSYAGNSSAGDNAAQFNAKVATVNGLIRANWPSFADAIADVAANASLSDPANTTFFWDGVHTNGVGRGIVAQIVSNAIQTIPSSLAPNEVWMILMGGESNSGGIGENSDLLASELLARSSVRIWNNDSPGFENLDIGTNNLLSHTGLTGVPGWTNWHGWEAGLANAVEAGSLPNPVYLVKFGQGGSTISQWNVGGTYWSTMVSRINAAKAAIEATGKVPRIVVWYTLGINDRIAGTSAGTWRSGVESFISSFRGIYGSNTPFIMPRFMPFLVDGSTPNPNANFNAEMLAMSAADPLIYTVDGNAALKDDNHWSAAGLKTLANRIVNIMNTF